MSASSSGEQFPGTVWLGHVRVSPIELAALLGGLALFGNLAWDSALWDGRLQLLLHLIAIAAIGFGVVAVLRGAPLPMTRLEVPALALLAALGLATLTAENAGLAARALAASIGYAAGLPLAIAAVRRRPELVAGTVVIPTLFLAATILWQLVARRVGWFGLGLGGLPPVRLPGETTAFGSVAVPPFILLGLLPLCLLLEPRWLRVTLLAATAALLLPLAAVSGSRSAWLAMGAAGLVFLLPLSRRIGWRRLLASGARRIELAVAAVAVVGVGLVFVAPRFTAITSLLYRERLWRDTLAAMANRPLLGIGPGTMPYARQAAAQAGLPPVRQPHSHDLALGLLGDGGIVALAAGIALVVVFLWVAGPHRSRSIVGRAASSVLIGFLVAGLFEDLTFLPGFDLIVLALAAVALLDAGVVRWARLDLPRPAPWLAGAGAAALLTVVLVGDAGAAAFRLGTEAVWAGRWPDAAAWYRSAIALDPWHPSGPKALAVAADAIGDESLALGAARSAVRLNAGDGASWTNLALLCLGAGDAACAQDAISGAERTAGSTGLELVNAALMEQTLGHQADADRLYGLSLLTNRATALATSWPRSVALPFETVDTSADASPELTALIAQVATGATPTVPATGPASVRALALAMRGERASAEEALASAERDASSDPLTWDLAAVLRRHWGEDASEALRVAAFLHGAPLADHPGAPPQVTYEVASLRPYPGDLLVRGAHRLRPDPPWPWVLDRFLPAERSGG